MKTDKELLQLAAKAARKDLTGYEWIDTPFYTGFQRRNIDPESGFEEQTQEYNPLVDDAQVFRLAVDLDMDVCLSPKDKAVTAFTLSYGAVSSHTEPYGTDKHAATRRAIVRAAAAIGEGM